MNVKDYESNICDEQIDLINEIFDIDRHWIDRAYSIVKYQNKTGFSERKLAVILGISKSEIHRLITVGKLRPVVRDDYKNFKVDKWAILELVDASKTKNKHNIHEAERLMSIGQITTRTSLRDYLCHHGN